ncbi:Thioredoxin [Musa troglodytarum]|uniref:Thioredoxin n=1 Tax=Musa troglodytarum TaxID=320322 RepID=A0A9E7ETI6_9LILI|nr:Thioredoxin [Musa troglodytarum]
MALRIAFSTPSIRSPSSSSSCTPSPSSLNRSLGCWPLRRSSGGSLGASGAGGRAVAARSSLETAVPAVGQVTEVDKDTFWPLVKASGDRVVVLDMYTQWCGPCKHLAKELGIKVVPTFKILKDGKVVKEVTGAKFDDLVLAIETYV